MRDKSLFTRAVCLLASLIFLSAYQGQNPQWKGTIEDEDGIRVIKNPNEPLYGEITFDLEEDLSIGNEEDENDTFYRFVRLEVDSEGNIFALDAGNGRIQKFDKDGKYLQTIGRQGQGPGELNRPTKIVLDKSSNIYVVDGRKIHIFDASGKFQNSISSNLIINELAVTSQRNFLALIYVMSKEEGKPIMLTQMSLLDPECNVLKTLSSVPMKIPPPPPQPFNIGDSYSPELFFCPISKESGVYGISSEYKLFIINPSGEVVYAFEKDYPPETFSKKEKERIIEDYKESMERFGRERKFIAEFPKYKPIFFNILDDDKGRIYVNNFELFPEGEAIVNFDLFNREGYYLYKVKMSKFPMIIKNGSLYTVERDKETELLTIKRYKIKNWEQIETGI